MAICIVHKAGTSFIDHQTGERFWGNGCNWIADRQICPKNSALHSHGFHVETFFPWRSQSRHSSTSRPLQVAGSFRRQKVRRAWSNTHVCIGKSSEKRGFQRDIFTDFHRLQFSGLEVHCVGPSELPRGKGHGLMADVLGWTTTPDELRVTAFFVFSCFFCCSYEMIRHIYIMCGQASSLTSCTSWNTCSSKNLKPVFCRLLFSELIVMIRKNPEDLPVLRQMM